MTAKNLYIALDNRRLAIDKAWRDAIARGLRPNMPQWGIFADAYGAASARATQAYCVAFNAREI